MATLAELLSTHHGKHVLPALQRTVLLSPGFVLNIHYQTLFSWFMLVRSDMCNCCCVSRYEPVEYGL